jgi:integrase
MAKSKRKRAPKTVLKLPDLEQSKSAVLNSLPSASSKRSYDHAIREFIDWYCSEPRLAFNKTVVARYRIALEQYPYAPSTINLRLAAIRRLAYEASDCGLLSPDLAAGIRRVKGVRRLGVRVGNWLTAEEGKKLLGTEQADTLRSRRNCALLSVLIGCGLRRAEVTALRLEDFQLREGHLGHCGSQRKGRSRPHDSRSAVGKGFHRQMGRWCQHHLRAVVPVHQQGRKDLGRWLYAEGHLGDCEGKCQKLRSFDGSPARPTPDLRTVVSPVRRRTGTDSVSLGSRLHPDDRAISRVQTAVSECG